MDPIITKHHDGTKNTKSKSWYEDDLKTILETSFSMALPETDMFAPEHQWDWKMNPYLFPFRASGLF